MSSGKTSILHCYFDGSCDTKTKNGGWAYTIEVGRNPEITFVGSGGKRGTTNNEMEQNAFLQLLDIILFSFPDTDDVYIYGDSEYVLLTYCKKETLHQSMLTKLEDIDGRILGWCKKKELINLESLDLGTRLRADVWITTLDRLSELFKRGTRVHLRWVKSHSGNPGNSFVDSEALSQVHKLNRMTN